MQTFGSSWRGLWTPDSLRHSVKPCAPLPPTLPHLLFLLEEEQNQLLGAGRHLRSGPSLVPGEEAGRNWSRAFLPLEPGQIPGLRSGLSLWDLQLIPSVGLWLLPSPSVHILRAPLSSPTTDSCTL